MNMDPRQLNQWSYQQHSNQSGCFWIVIGALLVLILCVGIGVVGMIVYPSVPGATP